MIKLPAIICDIDGTLALRTSDRSPFDWMRVKEDGLNIPVASVVSSMKHAAAKVILFSGRDSICRKLTEEWLEEYAIEYDELFMRKHLDNRKDTLVKSEMFQNNIKDKYDVFFVLDDRDRVVDMWRKAWHLACFQVAPGDF